MRLSCRTKILLNTEMHPDAVRLKPHPAAFGQFGRLAHFRNAEQAGIEASRHAFTARRHGELDMVESNDWTFGHRCIVTLVLFAFVAGQFGVKLQSSDSDNPSRKICDIAAARSY